jgi:hypothetical protein
VFIVYAIPIGLLAGRLTGGSIEGLARLRFRWVWLAVGGLAFQVLLFDGPLGPALGDLAPAAYVASTAAVFVAVLRNLALPGLWLVALGSASNLLAIVANGGYMPFDPAAAATAGLGAVEGVSNSALVAEPSFLALTDIFALPAWVPLANVYSIGDVLIGAGVGWAIVAAMRAGAPAAAPGEVEPAVVAGRGSGA